MNVSKRRTAKSHCRDGVGKIALHQHHVGGVDGYIRSRAYRYAYVGTRQRRRVVYSVSYHGDFALLLQTAHHFFLSVRHNARYYFVDAGDFSYRIGGAFIVAGKHYHPYAHLLKLGDGSGAVLFDGVRHRYYARKHAAFAKQQRRFALIGQFFRFLDYFRRHADAAANKFETARQQIFLVRFGADSVAGQSGKVLRRQRLDVHLAALLHNGLCQRMLALVFQRSRHFH